MLKLLAIAAGDGWAFVRHNGGLDLVKPPYRKPDMLAVKETEVAEAIGRYGFVPANREFEDWAELIAFLKDEFVRSRRELGQKIDIDKIRDIIRFAPPDILEKYLKRIENELFPRNQYQAASVVLERMLQLERVKQNKDLLQKTQALLNTCQLKESLRAEALRSLVDQEKDMKRRYPALTKKIQPRDVADKMQRVQTEGLLSMGH